MAASSRYVKRQQTNRRPETELAYRAGMLRPLTRAHGLSLGERACLALAQQLNLPVLTADRSWSELHIGVDVRVIR